MHKMVSLVLCAVFVAGCQQGGADKIQLADTAAVQDSTPRNQSQILHVDQSLQKTIAISAFKNESGDSSLNWLERGLADMLVTDLSQSPYLNLILHTGDATEQHGSTAAGEAEIYLSGRFYTESSELCIDVQMADADDREVKRIERVHGEGLEKIFSMVTQLSEQVRNSIRVGIDDTPSPGMELAMMTTSVEAFRWYSEALENIQKFMLLEAEQSLEEAVKIDPEFADGHLQLARISLRLGKIDQAEQALSRAQEHRDKLTENGLTRLVLVEAQVKAEFLEYHSLLESAVEEFPNDVDLRIELAQLYRNMGKFEQSLEHFEISLEIDPNRKLVYNDLGYLYAQRGDFTTALKCIEHYQRLAPDEPNPYDSEGEILMWAGELEKAEKALLTALEKWPQFFNSSRGLSNIYAEMGRYEEALHQADLAIENSLSESNKPALSLQKVIILDQMGRTDDALALLEDLVEDESVSAVAFMLAGDLYQSIGRPEMVLKLQEEAIERFTERIDYYGSDYGHFNTVLWFALNAETPTAPLVELVEHTRKSPGVELADIIDFTHAYLNLRMGNSDVAAAVFSENGTRFFDLLSKEMNRGWGGGWKYFFELADYDGRGVDVSRTVTGIKKYAEETQRHDLKVLAAMFHSRAQAAKDSKSRHHETLAQYGTPVTSAWELIGPFSTQNVYAFKHKFPPELEINLDATYESGEHTVTWETASDPHNDGYLDLAETYDDSYGSVAYALTSVYSPEQTRAQIRLGTDEACKLWLNDEQIWQRYTKDDAQLDRDLVTVVLRPGSNKLLLKVQNGTFDWGFYLRITDEDGMGIEGVEFQNPRRPSDFVLID